ncbi:MAG: DM13 domain-containing protein [Cyanobacteria bacterium]|nr:DM13 domain-containing protein [Cyanobacteria bacterium bin.51]
MTSSRLAIHFGFALGFGFAVAGISGCAGPETNQGSLSSPLPQDAALAAKSEPLLIRSGSFVSGEHPTKGAAQLVKENNKYRLDLNQDFSTSTSGPDLVVVLHRKADVIASTIPPAFPINEADYVLLAPLKSYSGAQSYPIPESINLDEFKSAAIWCRRFNATFGSATLQ